MTPEPINLDDGEFEVMDRIPPLRPHIRRLLDEMKTGHLLGANASEYRDELEKADKASDFANLRGYVFFGTPETPVQEGDTYLVIQVQRRYDLIVKCKVFVRD